MVFADCACGWAGPVRWCDGQLLPTEVAEATRAERAAQEAETGHGEDPADGAEGRHDFGRGFYDALSGRCPLPPDSPAGQLHRVQRGSLGDPRVALDRLRAIEELRGLLVAQEAEAALAARMSRATWAEMGDTVGISRQGAFNRWGATIKAYEAAGLVPEVGPGSPGRSLRWRFLDDLRS